MSIYPTGTDSFDVVTSGVSEVKSKDIIDLQNSVIAIETTIGTSNNYNFSEHKIEYANESFNIPDITSNISPISGVIGKFDVQLSGTPVDIPQFMIQTYSAAPLVYTPTNKIFVDSSGLVHANFGSNSKIMMKMNPTTGEEQVAFQLYSKDHSFVASNYSSYFYPDGDPTSNIVYLYGSSGFVKYNKTTYLVEPFVGRGISSYTEDGVPATGTTINPYSYCSPIFDSSGNFYFVHASGQTSFLKKVDAQTGIITTIAGSGAASFSPINGDGGPASGAHIHLPQAIAIDSQDNIYLLSAGPSSYPGTIRKIDSQTGIIDTICGTGSAGFSGDGGPLINAQIDIYALGRAGMFIDENDDLYFTDYTNQRIRKAQGITGTVTTVVGNGTAGYGHNMPATGATISYPWQVMIKNNIMYIVDNQNNYLSYVSGNNIYRVTASQGSPTGTMITRNELQYINTKYNYVTKQMDALPENLKLVFSDAQSYYDSLSNYKVFWSGTNSASLIYNFSSVPSAIPTGLHIQYHKLNEV